MPRNTLPILIRFVNTVEPLKCHLLASQDIITFNTGEIVKETQKFFDEATMGEDHENDEGDFLKVLVTGQEDYPEEIAFYNDNLQGKLADFKKFLESAELKQVQPSRVLHCPQAHGVVITSNHGWKVTYSGDCRPTAGLVADGKDSTLCIHEATFQSSLAEQAKQKMHSTVEEATQVAIKMNAQRACLTHFSQRYTVSESLLKKKKRGQMDIDKEVPYVKEYLSTSGVMAVDLLKFKLSELAKLPILSPGFNFAISDDN